MTTMLTGDTKLEAKESLWVAVVDFRKAFHALEFDHRGSAPLICTSAEKCL